MKYEHPRDISIWCEKSEERVLQTIDTILDKTDIKNKKAKKLLTEATKILKEIEELKSEAQAKL
jgi:hypothetical protein